MGRLIVLSGIVMAVIAFVNPGTALGLAIAGLVIAGVVAVFSPGRRADFRRTVAPLSLGIIAVVLLSGYVSSIGLF